MSEKFQTPPQERWRLAVEDQIIVLDTCPRCGQEGFEQLSEHSYCVACNYAPELEPGFYIEFPDSVLAQAEELGLRSRKAQAIGRAA